MRKSLFLIVALACISAPAHAQTEGNLIVTGYAVRSQYSADFMLYAMHDGSEWLLDLTNFRHGTISFKDAAGQVYKDPNRQTNTFNGTNETTWSVNESDRNFFTEELLMFGPFVPDKVKIYTSKTQEGNPRGYNVYKMRFEGGPGIYWYQYVNENW